MHCFIHPTQRIRPQRRGMTSMSEADMAVNAAPVTNLRA